MRSNDEIVDIIITEKDKQGLSLSELARRVGMAKSALSRYFNKTRAFPLNRTNDFANALGISVEYLLGYGKDITSAEDLSADKKIKEYLNSFKTLSTEQRQEFIDFTKNATLQSGKYTRLKTDIKQLQELSDSIDEIELLKKKIKELDKKRRKETQEDIEFISSVPKDLQEQARKKAQKFVDTFFINPGDWKKEFIDDTDDFVVKLYPPMIYLKALLDGKITANDTPDK